jgi:uncharacterized repeat protein (TIGR01451 family)
MRLPSTARKLAPAVLLTAFLLGADVSVQAQQGLQAPVLPPVQASKVTSQPPAKLPTLPAPSIIKTPALPTVPGAPLDTGKTPVAAGSADVSIHDMVIGATDGQNPANPTGRQEPGVSIEWLYPPNARLNQPVTCTLIVKSISINRLHQVVVRGRVPAGAVVKSTEPKATNEGDLLVWRLGDMEPRQERRIDLHLVPTVRGSLPCHAFVTFTGSSTAQLQVREPKLALKATAPKSVLAGEAAIVTVTVSNPGDAKADHVRLRVSVPQGLEYRTGKEAQFNLESLGPNESRTILLQCVARASGAQVCSAVATADANLEARGSTRLDVVSAHLEVSVTGPKMRYLDCTGKFFFKVTNTGTAPATHVNLTNVVPQGFKVASATTGAYHDFATRSVVWFWESLGPGQTREVELDLLAVNPGEYRNQATVTATHGVRAAADASTRIEGLPGLLMELVDLEDPVPVGKDLSYEIRLANTGTKTATNLLLTCTLSDKMTFRGAKCPTGITYQVQGKEVVFGAVPRLAPRADVIFRVNVRCLAPGDLRFQARVRADGLVAPVLREESTRVFGDEHDGGATAPGQK